MENAEIVANVENFVMTENDSITRATKFKVGLTIYTPSISTLCQHKVKQSSNWSTYADIQAGGKAAEKEH